MADCAQENPVILAPGTEEKPKISTGDQEPGTSDAANVEVAEALAHSNPGDVASDADAKSPRDADVKTSTDTDAQLPPDADAKSPLPSPIVDSDGRPESEEPPKLEKTPRGLAKFLLPARELPSRSAHGKTKRDWSTEAQVVAAAFASTKKPRKDTPTTSSAAKEGGPLRSPSSASKDKRPHGPGEKSPPGSGVVRPLLSPKAESKAPGTPAAAERSGDKLPKSKQDRLRETSSGKVKKSKADKKAERKKVRQEEAQRAKASLRANKRDGEVVFGCVKCRFLKYGCFRCRKGPSLKPNSCFKPEHALHPDVPSTPAYYPTEEEFEDPLEYIEKIRPEAEQYGTVRIVPPPSFQPAFALPNKGDLRFGTRIQALHELMCREAPNEGVAAKEKKQGGKKDKRGKQRGNRNRGAKTSTKHRQEGGADGGAESEDSEVESSDDDDGRYGFKPGVMHSLQSFEKYDKYFRTRYFRNPENIQQPVEPSIEQIEGEFWRLVRRRGAEGPEGEGGDEVEVIYGADVPTMEVGSGFAQMATAKTKESRRYAQSAWNVCNLPRHEASALRYEEAVTGITVPWLYFGMCMSAFCWHVEDHHLYSVNYLHYGAPKVWYSVPARASEAFEAAMKKRLPHLFQQQADLLYSLVTMVPPAVLQEEGVPVYRTVQEKNNFIITFPYAYHAGFNTGYNCAESTNFAPPDWLHYGAHAMSKYKLERHVPPLSHDKLLIQLAGVAPFCPPRVRLALPDAFEARVADERSLRQNAAGMYSASERLRQGSPNDTEDCICSVCNTDIYWSAFVCACDAEAFTCLHHSGCECAPSKRKFLYRNTLEELDSMATAVRQVGEQARREHAHLPHAPTPPVTHIPILSIQ